MDSQTEQSAADVELAWLEWMKAERDRLQGIIDEMEAKRAARVEIAAAVNEYEKKDAAAFLGVTIRTVESLATQGKLTPRYVAFKHGRKAIYREDELLKLRGTFAATDSPTSTARPGYVYVLGTPDGYYKIGLSRVLLRRVADIRLQLPYQVELIHLIATQNMGAAERDLHQRFASCRMNGEWFKLSAEDLEWLKRQERLDVAA